jgi:spore germination cell wall hydrolase CwlJ-like protein
MQRRRSLVAFAVLAALGTAHVAMAAMPDSVTRIATAPIIGTDADQGTDPDGITFRPAVATIANDTLGDVRLDTGPDEAATDTNADDTTDAPVNARELECMAKVIVHEAGNQPYRGQMAVAQVIRTRMKKGFGDSACAVVKQPGQFFDVDAYQPAQTGRRWNTAIEIATDTLQGEGDEVVPGALFFHSAGASMPTRTRVAQIADHTFYR